MAARKVKSQPAFAPGPRPAPAPLSIADQKARKAAARKKRAADRLAAYLKAGGTAREKIRFLKKQAGKE